MPRNKLTPDNLILVQRGYLMRLSAVDTCQVLNQSRDPKYPIAPSTVSYQYAKFRAEGLQQRPLKDILELADSPKPTKTQKPQKNKAATPPSPTLDNAHVEDFA